jgi:hypothetical protein
MAMPREMTMDRVETGLAKLLLAFWWVLFPPFAILVCRFSFERGCRDPYELLQPIMQRQAGALLVAAIYVGAYLWVLAAGTLTIRLTQSAVSLSEQLGLVWGAHRWKVLAMAAALAVEQVPRAVWHWIYRIAGVC